MIPSLIVETGLIVEDANSYCDLDYVKHFCINRGLDLPADDNLIIAAMILAINYLESKSDKYMGHLSDSSQSLSFPRKLLKVNNYLRASDEIPKEIKDAQSYATYLICDGEDLQPLVNSGVISEAGVASLSVKFKQNEIIGDDGRNYFTPVDDILARLYVKDTGYRISKRISY